MKGLRNARKRMLWQILLDAFSSNLFDSSPGISPEGGARRAAEVARFEIELLSWVGSRYPSMRDHLGKQAILVRSSYGDVIVGADALAHVSFDHPSDPMRRRATIWAIVDAIENPLGPPTKTAFDAHGRPSNRRVGLQATVVTNPETGEMITAWASDEDDFDAVGIRRRGRRRR